MKALPILILLTAAAGADDLIPQAFPKDRYNDTIGKSPFVLETKVVEQAPPAQNPFANLYLRSVSKADGKDYVLIQRLGEERPLKPFIGNEPGAEEYSVKSVRVGNSFRETKVVLQKGTDIGEIGFKEDSINTPPPVANAGRGPGLPGAFPKPGGPVPMPQMPGAQARPQQITPVQAVPRPGGTTSMPMPVQQPVAIPQTPGGGGGGVRTRPRTINN